MLTPDTHLGHFTVLSRIGVGGMGEVYRARDERLEREVAVKVLPAEVARDAERLARFEREAKVLARLSHPNILAIYEFDKEGDLAFVVTELLKGETLQERMGKGKMPLRRALDVGAAVADGLATAHEAGVVHRDIKPSNVFLTGNDTVKILDFGLASLQVFRQADKPESGEDTTLDYRERATLTQKGTVLGTPGYMSPEQVNGRSVDARADIFSLGCVLYEMLSGRPAFRRATPMETFAAILNEEPPEISVSGIGAAPELARTLRRCLEKNPALRFQSASDLSYALRSLRESTPSAGTVSAAALTKARPFVAVLPFANLTADPEQEYFCDGMAEELINALAQVSGLRVVARTSAFAFKGQNTDVREIGRQLDVSAVVEGSVRKAGDKLRVTAQLIDTRDGLHLWSGRFDRKLEDVFEIQDEISLAVVGKLEVELLGRERAAVVKRPTDNVDAHNACLRGWYHWNKLTPEGHRLAFEYFQEAIDLDPGLTWAYAGLIAGYGTMTFWGELPPEALLATCMPMVEKVRELDEDYLTNFVPAYFKAFFEYDWDGADRGFQRAIELAPNMPEPHVHAAAIRTFHERFDEALAYMETCRRIDPLSPLWAGGASTWLAYAGRYDDALAGLEELVAMHPQHWLLRFLRSYVNVKASRLEQAKADAQIAVEMSGGLSRTLTQLASICYLTGDHAKGDELFATLRKRAQETWVPPTQLGWLHLARGEVDEAFDQFDEALRRKDPLIPSHRIDSPVPIEPHPRLDALRAKLNLPR